MDLSIFISIQLCIHLYSMFIVYKWIHLSIYLYSYASIYIVCILYINGSIYLYSYVFIYIIYMWIYLSLSLSLSIYVSTFVINPSLFLTLKIFLLWQFFSFFYEKLLVIYPSIYLSIHLSIYLPIYLASYLALRIQSMQLLQGADFQNNQTTKQLNSFIWTNGKVETKLYLLPIGPNKIVQLFSCLIVF